ncbi:hypothetical protein JOD57_002799 [Geodermatophilus bullaregiensis]|uniref:hypothetical protein n=1 Tax=Geodermatophilus bullaregiensis TaxID=1564160 RepID=UPI001956BF32|nr:hypothetical protein [Geodermatophilus bullaregiensis]MBM7806962.1 hypothetical protein [Geodermatophilus bullaregiensis]
MRRRFGCALSASAVLAATVLPWSSTAAAGRTGWETASLALALGEAVHRPVLTALACAWSAVPLAAAGALVVCVLLPRSGAAAALRGLGALVVLDVLVVLVAVHLAGLHVLVPGPLLALAGGAALAVLPARCPPGQPRRPAPAVPRGPRR